MPSSRTASADQPFAEIRCERVPWRGAYRPAEANINRQHPAEAAAWIWAEDWHLARPQVLRFTRSVQIAPGGATLRFHVSADQRFQLRVGDTLLARGPDRGDVEHWSVASYELSLPAGRHTFSALVWWLPSGLAPEAQMTWRGGFLFAAEGDWQARLSTGTAAWRVEDLTPAVGFTRPEGLGYHVIGTGFDVALGGWKNVPRAKPLTVSPPLGSGNLWGVRRAGWRLSPTPLPEQRSELFSGGRIRVATNSRLAESAARLLRGEAELRVAPNRVVEVIWDFDDYVCGYPELTVAGGAGARVEFSWAESLYAVDPTRPLTADTPKDDRAATEGKAFLGFGDAWTLDGRAAALPALWWRSGRYVRLRIRTGNAALRLRSLAVRRTGYPLRLDGRFECDDRGWQDALPLMRRGLEMCAHETWVDCPYYEQLCYVGDAVTEISLYPLSRDAGLTRRCIELFDWSRSDGGLVAERYPSATRQDSTTYALLYPRLLRDYALWRDDAAFVVERLPGLRALMEQCLVFRRADGLLGAVAGWPFIDWVPEWKEGCGPGVREGDSSLLNLHLVLALQQQAELERGFGESGLARRADGLAREIGRKIVVRFLDPRSGLLADDGERKHFSEHAQALGILAGVLGAAGGRRCLRSWLGRREQLAPASIYFSFYVLEALQRLGAGEELHRRLAFWKGLSAQGFLTPPERPEPSRSDCHGWGAHPLYHSFASIAGIRPAAPGFARVRIAPQLAAMRRVRVSMPHPRGTLRMDLRADEGLVRLSLPKGVSGEFVWAGECHALRGGENRLVLAPARGLGAKPQRSKSSR
jgi:alpha-L-rhamnosidase